MITKENFPNLMPPREILTNLRIKRENYEKYKDSMSKEYSDTILTQIKTLEKVLGVIKGEY